MPSTVAVGGFFGDEGKGKIISYLSKKIIPQLLFVGELDQMRGIQSKMVILLTRFACYQVDF